MHWAMTEKSYSQRGACALAGIDPCVYIELFYNSKRKHTNNGMLSPVDLDAKQQKLAKAGV